MKALVVRKKFLRVFDGSSVRVIKAPGPITDHVVCTGRDSSSEESWQVLVLVSHKIYRLHVTALQGMEEGDGEADFSNQEIFTDLLDQPKQAFAVSPQTDPVIALQDKHVLLVSKDSLCLVEVTNNLLLALTSGPQPAVKAYRLSDLTQDKGSLPCFEIPCPSFEFGSEENKQRLYVACCDQVQEGLRSSKCLNLPPSLFSAFFKSEAALLNSTVILYTLNGCVFFKSIKSFSKTDDQWEVLCDIVGSVVDIFILDIESESDLPFGALQPVSSKCETKLLVCSSTGKIIIIHLSITNNAVKYDFVDLPGQNVCSQIHNSFLYHCTGERLYRHAIQLNPGGDNSVVLESEYLHQSLVNEFLVVTENAAEHLLCLSREEEIFKLPTTAGGKKSGADKSYLDHLVTGLTDTSHRLEEIQTRHSRLNVFLNQLSIAGFLQSKDERVSKMFHEKFPVSSKCCVVSQKSGYSRNYKLVCSITNQGSQALSNEWSLMVVMETSNQLQTETRSNGIPLSYGLKSGSTFDFEVAMEEDCVLSEFCDVSVYLVLHTSLLDDQESFSLHTPVPKTSKHGLPVLVNCHRIDVLYFLHQPITELVDSAVSTVTSPLVDFCPMKSIKREKENGARNHSYSFSVCAPRVCLPENEKDLWNESDSSSNKVLKFLLKDAQIPTEDIHRGQTQLLDPAGHMISVAIETGNSSGCEEGLEVQLCSESVSLLARCRAAVTDRIEAFIKTESREITVKGLKKYLSEIENLKDEVTALEVSPDLRSRSEKEVTQVTGQLYEQLRNTHFLNLV